MKIHLMGSDQRIVRCARVSFGKDEEVDRERDTRLIKYLLQHRHASPFEHVVIAFEGSRELWLSILNKLPSPAVQVYYSGGYLWVNLRNYINAVELFPPEVEGLLCERLPATTAIMRGKEPDGYSTDTAYMKERRETSSGWVGLVDSLELGTDMDYYAFVVECPLFVARQWHRHRFGSYNEVSRRYVS
ncbi:MAG: thymidylate synthase (FAD), partial [Aquificota bacterium]